MILPFYVKQFFLFASLLLCSFVFVARGQDAQENGDFKLALKLYEDKSYDLSLDQFKRFTEKYASSANAIESKFYIGLIQLKLGELDDARFTFQNFALSYSTNPKAPQAWWNVAGIFERQKNFKEAAGAYERLKIFFEKDATVPDALLKASDCFHSLRDVTNEQRVLKTITRDYASSKAFPKARLRLAMMSIENGDVQLAQNELTKIAGESTEKDVQSQAMLSIGKLQLRLAKYDDAAKTFRSIIEKFPSSAPEAYLALGKLSVENGKYLEAIESFKKGAKDSGDVGEEALLDAGNSFLALNDETNALAYYEQWLASFPASMLKQNVLTQAGIASARAKKLFKAKEYFQQAMQGADDSSKKIILLHYAEGLMYNGDYLNAANLYEQVATICNDDINSPQALFRSGKTLLENVGDFEDAKRIFIRIVEKYPGSSLADKALFASAVCEDSLRNYTKALRIYSSFKKQFPSSSLVDSADERGTYIQTHLEKDYSVAVEKLALLVGDAIGGGNKGNVAYRLGEIYFNDFKNYAAAASQFEHALTSDLSAAQRPDAQLYIAKSKALAGDTKDAISMYGLFIKSYPAQQHAEEAAYAMYELQQASATSAEQVTLAGNILAAHPALLKKDVVLLSLAKAFEANGQTDTSKKTYQQVIEGFTSSESVEEAYFRLGLLYKRNGVADSARSVWEREIKNYPDGKYSAKALYALAEILLQMPATDSSKNPAGFLQLLKKKFSYTDVAANADSMEVEALLQEKKNDEAIEALQSSIRDIKGNLFSTSSLFPFYMKLGGVYSEKNNITKCREYYVNALSLDHHSASAAQAFFALGNIEKTSGNNDLAAAYFRQASALGATGTAQKNIADLLFDTEQYVDAIRLYEELKRTTEGDSIKKYIEMRIILAKLRSENLLGAKPLLDDFEKKYAEDKMSVGTLEIERARYFIRQSNLQTSTKILENILDANDNPEIRARVYYWKGKIYESKEKPDSALLQYRRALALAPQSDIMPRLLLSFGNIAYNAEQFDSAISYYQQVLAMQERAQDIVPLAMSNLIEAFQSIKLYDAALKATRDFITAFPNDESVLNKKINMGVLYTRLGYFEQAVLHFQKLLDDYGSDVEAEVRYDIGEAYYYKNDYNQAILEFLKVPYLVTKKMKIDWTATSLYMAGQSYEQLSKYDNAIEMYQQIIDRTGIDPTFKASAQKEIERVKTLLKKG